MIENRGDESIKDTLIALITQLKVAAGHMIMVKLLSHFIFEEGMKADTWFKLGSLLEDDQGLKRNIPTLNFGYVFSVPRGAYVESEDVVREAVEEEVYELNDQRIVRVEAVRDYENAGFKLHEDTSTEIRVRDEQKEVRASLEVDDDDDTDADISGSVSDKASHEDSSFNANASATSVDGSEDGDWFTVSLMRPYDDEAQKVANDGIENDGQKSDQNKDGVEHGDNAQEKEHDELANDEAKLNDERDRDCI